jgi:regulatory protein
MDDDHTITEFKTTKRDPLMRLIKVGRRTVAKMTVSQIHRLGIEVGQPWDAHHQEVADMLVAEDKATRHAIRLLARRPYSIAEIRKNLAKKYDEPTIDTVVDQLTQRRLLDDEAIARLFIEQQRRRQPTGPFLLKQKLRRMGVEDRVISDALAESEEAYDAVVAGTDLARKKLATSSFQKIDAAGRRHRLYGLLSRRGFDQSVIQAVLNQLDLDLDDPDANSL